MPRMTRSAIALVGLALIATTTADAIVKPIPMTRAASPVRAAAVLAPTFAPAPRLIELPDHRAGFVDRDAAQVLGRGVTIIAAGGLGWG